jgi:kinetochore protein Mis12/MTW1
VFWILQFYDEWSGSRYCASHRAFTPHASGKIRPVHNTYTRLTIFKSLIDDVINSINTIGNKAVDWVEQGLLSTPLPNLGFPDPASGKRIEEEVRALEGKVKLEIENGVHQFETLLEATIDKNFDKLEVFALRSIIAIPEELRDWIRLKHYEVYISISSEHNILETNGANLQGLNFTLSPDAPTLESITLQRRKFQESQRLHRLLQAEVARNNALIAQLKTILASTPAQILPKTEPSDTDPETSSGQPPYPALAFLSQKGDLANSSASTPLSTTTAFALSQLPSLKALLADLRPQMKTLASAPAARDPNLTVGEEESEKSWRKQRLEYVEAQTRRVQENVRGLELGAQGEVRDGEWQEQGTRIARGEVEALERVVAMIRGRGRGDEMDEGA